MTSVKRRLNPRYLNIYTDPKLSKNERGVCLKHLDFVEGRRDSPDHEHAEEDALGAVHQHRQRVVAVLLVGQHCKGGK